MDIPLKPYNREMMTEIELLRRAYQMTQPVPLMIREKKKENEDVEEENDTEEESV